MHRNQHPMPIVTTELLYESDQFTVTSDRVDGEPVSVTVVAHLEGRDGGPATFTTLERECLDGFTKLTRRWQIFTPEQAEVEACLGALAVGGQPLVTH